MGKRENVVETYLDAEVEKIGGITRKWTCPSHDGVPDRIVIIHNDVWFVEVKTTDGRLSGVQVREHKRLKEHGANVATVYGKMDVDMFINALINS